MSNENAPQGPWDAPLRDFVKDCELMVSVYDLKDGKLIKEEKINYGNYEHRKFLGRITFWAVTSGYSVETMSLEDFNREKAKEQK